MNLTNEMRFNAAKELTDRVYGPKLEALSARWTDADMTRLCNEVARAGMDGTKYPRFDDLEPGDVPELKYVRIEFDTRHLAVAFSPPYRHEVRSGSQDEAVCMMHQLLSRRVHLLQGMSRYRQEFSCDPIRVPYKKGGFLFELESGQTYKDGQTLTQLHIKKFATSTKVTTKNKQAWRLWKHFEAVHVLLNDAMEFHAKLLSAFKQCRTLKTLDEKWPGVSRDFREVNNIVEDGNKKVSVEVLDPMTMKSMDALLNKARTEHAKQQEQQANG